MARRITHPDLGYVGSKKLIRFNHRVVLGAAGAISSQDAPKDSGVIAVKTATKTGRYTLTSEGGVVRHKRFRGGTVTLIGPDDTAYGALTVGLTSIWRKDDIAASGLGDGTIEVQFLNASGNWTDAELPTGTIMIFDYLVEV